MLPQRACDREAANTQTARTRGIRKPKTHAIHSLLRVIFPAVDVKPPRIEKLCEQQHMMHAWDLAPIYG